MSTNPGVTMQAPWRRSRRRLLAAPIRPIDAIRPPADGDVGFEGLASGPIDDEAAANDQIESTSHPLV
jgi:hypothetical protein